MKKVYVFEVHQHRQKSYVGAAPARDLVRMATKVELEAPQDANRPVNPKRLQEIAQFVAESDGMLSSSIVIGTNNNLLSVHPVEGMSDVYYLDFPETETEFKKFENSFEIMDGQHRLFSFLQDYIKLADGEPFDLSFQLYIKPTLRDRRMIFKNTNEKQEKVASNLLMWFRKQLNMLSEKEEKYYGVVALLNNETVSPLKGRIIMSAEKVVGGFKAKQIISILDKANIQTVGTAALDDQQMLKMISEYLSGWENAVGTKISDRDALYGAFSKIAGFRFMVLMLPAFYKQAVADRQSFSADYVKKKIDTLCANNGIAAADIFDKTSEYMKGLGGNPFSSETQITALASDWIQKLGAITNDSFDPLA